MIAPGSEGGISPGRLFALKLLTTGLLVGATFGQFTLGQLSAEFVNTHDFSISVLGLGASLMFAAGGLASFPLGWLTDLVSPVWFVIALPVLAALATLSYSFVSHEAGLIAVCVVIGILMAPAHPVANRIIVNHLPRSSVNGAMGWKSVGPQVAAVMAALAFGLLGTFIPWQGVLVLWLAISILFTVWGTLTLTGARNKYPELTDADARSEVDGPLRSDPVTRWLILYIFFSSGTIASVATLLPLYGITQMGLSDEAAGLSVAVAAGVSVLGRFMWVRILSDRNISTTHIVASLLAAASVGLLALAPSVGPWLFWTAIIAVGACALGSTPLPHISLVRNTMKSQVGMMSAWGGVAAYAGFIVQPWLITTSIDYIGFPLSWLIPFGFWVLAGTVIAHYAWIRRSRG